MSIFVPAQPFSPGEYIQDELDARGWAIDDLAEVTGITKRQIINLIQAKSGISLETAIALAQAFGHDAQTWMNLQAAYELAQAAHDDRSIARRAKVFEKAPVRELKRRGWITSNCDDSTLEKEVCRLLRIPTIDAQPDLAIAAKKGTTYDVDSASQIAWYCRCRELAEGVAAARYTDANWQPGIEKLLSLANEAENTRLVPSVLAEMGIRLICVQHLRSTKIDGIATWLDDNSPVVGMSLRFDRIDNFWFVLMHELVHIKHRHKSPVDVDLGASEDLPEIERLTNAEAANCIIPSDRLDSFIKRVHPHYYQEKIVQFANARKVHPGIVVGLLHGRGTLKYHQLRKLLVKVRDYVKGNALTDGWNSALQDNQE